MVRVHSHQREVLTNSQTVDLRKYKEHMRVRNTKRLLFTE